MSNQTFFELIPNTRNIPFVKLARSVFPFMVLYMLAALFIVVTKGFNYGVDFKGGTQIHVKFKEATDVGQIRTHLEALGIKDASVQAYGEIRGVEFLIRVLPEDLTLSQHDAQFQQALSPLQNNNQPPQLRYSEDRFYAVFNQAIPTAQIEAALSALSHQDLKLESVTPFGNEDNHEYVIQFQGIGNRIVTGLNEAYPDQMTVLQVEQVGEKVGKDLRTQALGAVLVALILMLVYIWFRFDFEFAPGAMVALFHDVIVVLAIFALFQLSFDLSIVAALLTIVGFSINDTIVVYDRIRENIKLEKDLNVEDVHNKSINQTLSRTVLTSGTVFVAAMSLLLLGGPITENFAIALAVGIFVGTFSSIFIASPMTIFVKRWQSRAHAG